MVGNVPRTRMGLQTCVELGFTCIIRHAAGSRLGEVRRYKNHSSLPVLIPSPKKFTGDLSFGDGHEARRTNSAGVTASCRSDEEGVRSEEHE